MEFGRVFIRHFPRRFGRTTTSITHQRRALSIFEFSSNSIDGYNHRASSHQNISIRQFSKKDLNNGDSSSNKKQEEEEDEGDEIIMIYGDRPEYESSTDKSKYTHEVKVEMPDIGDLKGGIIEKWYKQPGDIIHRDDAICDIRTESFTFGMVTDDDFDSVMGQILVEEESGMVDPGTVIFTTFSEEKHHRDGGGDKKDE